MQPKPITLEDLYRYQDDASGTHRWNWFTQVVDLVSFQRELNGADYESVIVNESGKIVMTVKG